MNPPFSAETRRRDSSQRQRNTYCSRSYQQFITIADSHLRKVVHDLDK